jgi:hypothetical protein
LASGIGFPEQCRHLRQLQTRRSHDGAPDFIRKHASSYVMSRSGWRTHQASRSRCEKLPFRLTRAQVFEEDQIAKSIVLGIYLPDVNPP